MSTTTPETIEPVTTPRDSDPQANLILYGSPWRVMWAMSWPAVAVMMLFGLNAVMDAVFIGQLMGEQALAGAVMAYPITQLTLGLGSLAGIGGGVALSIAIGRGERDLMRCLPGRPWRSPVCCPSATHWSVESLPNRWSQRWEPRAS